MTLGVTLVLAAAACAAHGCTVCVEYQTSKFEHECQERGGTVRSSTTQQWCVAGAAAQAAWAQAADDGGS